MIRLILILVFIPTLCFGQWTQIGNSINGQVAGDNCGWATAISADGTVVAMGSPFNDNGGSSSGQVRVFGLSNGVWSQIGDDLDGETSGDQTGQAVSLSDDGSVVAIGEPFNNDLGFTAGQVRVFVNSGGFWSQLGQDLFGQNALAGAGTSVDLSADGTTVAFGAPNTQVPPSTQFTGIVEVYQLQGNSWVQKGGDIIGDGQIDKFGQSVSLSADGNTIAIGQTGNPGLNPPSDIGRVKIFQFTNNQWVQVGNTINGTAVNDEFGYKVSLSASGTILAIGTFGAPNIVRVFQLANGVWTQLGNTMTGENAGDRFGFSISLSESGSMIAVGARFNGSNGAQSGRAYVFQNQGGNWGLVHSPIVGLAAGDQNGFSVALTGDGSKVAVGAINNDNGGSNAGQVRVFQNSSTLPVELAYFTGNYSDNAALLNWKVENQINFSHFVVERSLDGVVFSSLKDIQFTNAEFYNYKDTDLKNASIFYYRLKMVDKDGGFDYSNIIAITMNGKPVEGIFPNPGSGTFTLTGVKDMEDESFTIVNSVGQTLPVVIQNNGQFDLSSFPSGIYYLRISSSGQLMKLVKE